MHTAMTLPEMTQLAFPERRRTYHFPDGSTRTFTDVTHLGVSPSGTHRLETADGHKHIVRNTWTSITIDVDAWSL